MEACHEAGVHILTLYAFSTENWQRPRGEVTALMRLFGETIDREVGELHDFGENAIDDALTDYSNRERKFGGIPEPDPRIPAHALPAE